MSHNALINELVHKLVVEVTGKTVHEAIQSRDQAVKTLREQSHVRVDHFVVQAQIEGLKEKFSIVNREDLVEGLESCLTQVSLDYKWLPEALSLLLELSDRPAEKTDRDLLASLSSGEIVAREISWQDILAAEPLEDSDLWANIERGYHTSEDDDDAERSEPTVNTQATSVADNDEHHATSYLQQPDISLLSTLRESRQSVADHDLAELTIVRETLMMLHGIPTDVYDINTETCRTTVRMTTALAGTSIISSGDYLLEAAELGTALLFLRHWVRGRQQLTFVQSIQASISAHLSRLDAQVNHLEAAYLAPSDVTIVSVTDLRPRIEGVGRVFVQLSQMIKRSSESNTSHSPFSQMDALYEAACVSQGTGDPDAFRMFAEFFLAGLSTYSRMIAHWISSAAIVGKDCDVFFVRVSKPDCDLGTLWHEKFTLQIRDGSLLNLPKCWVPFANDIFAMGKSKHFLKEIGIGVHDDALWSAHQAQFPSFDTLYPNAVQESLVPFTQVLEDRLGAWVNSLCSSFAPRIHSLMLLDLGLLDTLNALPFTFLAKTGSVFDMFAERVIQHREDRRIRGLPEDALFLSMLAKDTIGSLREVDAANLYTEPRSTALPTEHALSDRSTRVLLGYSFSKPMQNIMRSRSPAVYTQALELLIQIRSSQATLTAQPTSLRTTSAVPPAVHKLRHRLLWFANALFHHATTASNALHQTMMRDMQAVDSIDAMVTIWSQHEQKLRLSLFLAPNLKPVRETIDRLLELCSELPRIHGYAGVTGLSAQFDRDLDFVVAAVRGVSRAGGDTWLEIFAEQLDWRVK